ncbi:MAG: hypothetical protein V3R29_10710 [Candidatus Acidoferrales bacterium]
MPENAVSLPAAPTSLISWIIRGRIMESTKTAQSWARRRSQRIPLTVPLLVSSLDPSLKFSERCETVSVSKHGCILRAPRELPPGASLRLDIPHTNRAATAHVVHSELEHPGSKSARIGLELDQAENFWGIQFPPEDWAGTALGRERQEQETPPPASPSPAAQATAGARPTAEAPTPSVAPSAAAAPLRRPATTTAPSPASPTAEQKVKNLESVLRDKAKSISAEFEDSYRQSLGDLLLRLRADLEEHSAKDWERLRAQAAEGLRTMVGELRQQVEQESQQRRQTESQTEATLQALQQQREQIEARLQSVGDFLREQVTTEREQLLSQTRDELKKLEEQFRQQVEVELARRTGATRELENTLEGIQQERNYVESLIRALPHTVDQQVQEGVSGTLQQIRTRLEEEFSAQREEQVEQLEQHLRETARDAEGDLRQKLFEDLERHEREFLDRINVRLGEVQAVEGGLRQYAQKTTTNLARQGEELRTRLEEQLHEQLARRQEEFGAQLEKKRQELNQRAEQVLRNLGEQTWTSLKQGLTGEFDQRQQELRQDLEIVQAQTGRLEERAEQLALRLDVHLEERLEQAMLETVERARERLGEESRAALEKHLAALQAQLDESLAPLVSRGEAISYDLHQLLESLRGQSSKVTGEVKQLQETTEKAKAWFAQEKQQSEQIVHDSLVEATGQIKGRIHQAVEMAQEPLERQARKLQEEFDQWASQTRAELARQMEETRHHLQAMQGGAESSIQRALNAHMAEILRQFREETDKVAHQSSARLQANLNETLESISRLLREKLS